jgi:hypothetical protein
MSNSQIRASYPHNSWCSGHDISWKYNVCYYASCRCLTSNCGSIYSSFSVFRRCVLIMTQFQPSPLNTPEGIPVGLGFLPLHHTYGLHQYAFRVFLKPYTLVLLGQWDIEVALKAIPKYAHFMSLCYCVNIISQIQDITAITYSLRCAPNRQPPQHLGS